MEMKRFVIELANEKKESDKRQRVIFANYRDKMRDENIVNIEIDRYIKAYKIGLMTELEAANAILNVKTWKEKE